MTLNNIYFSKDVLSKLIGIRFKDPSKSYSVFKYVQRINQELEFFSREIEKLREKYSNKENGSIDPQYEKKFIEESNKLLQIPIEKPPDLNITIDDILSAEFPDDKRTWLTASDYGILMDILKE